MRKIESEYKNRKIQVAYNLWDKCLDFANDM